MEVSWSPPTDQGPRLFNITGYRIFYGNGENVSVPTVITSVGISVNGSYTSLSVFIRSEAGQLHSELINASVGK